MAPWILIGLETLLLKNCFWLLRKDFVHIPQGKKVVNIVGNVAKKSTLTELKNK